MEYTAGQLRAIETIDRNLQIIACAGSGKTQVISRRIVSILERKKKEGITPANIVAFTFTEKAAAELKDRIQKLCIEHLGTDAGLAEMYVGTIHGYCLSLLQQPPVYEYLKYSVLTEVQQRLLIDRNSKKSGLTETPLLAGGSLKRYSDSRVYQALLSITEEGEADMRLVTPSVRDAITKYRELLDEKKYLDYSGILATAVSEIATNERLREKVRGAVRYLVVDEYQDVNPLQERLVREIAGLGANMCVVGDDDQTIYQWRGSDVRNIITFKKRYDRVTTVNLNENFRSSPAIVEVARKIIENNGERLPKRMESSGIQRFERGDLLAMQFPSVTDEACWVATKIGELHGVAYRDRPDEPPRGLAYSDMAVLVRAWRDAAPVVEALRDRGIAYIGGGMNSLLETPESRAIREAYYFLAGHEPRGAAAPSANTLRKLLVEAFPGITSAEGAAGCRYLEGIRGRLSGGSDNQLFLQRVYLDFLEAASIREERVGTEARSGEVIFFNLGKFSQLVSDFERINFHTEPVALYSAFARYLEFQAADYYPEETSETARAVPDAVRILTVHQAKGMQWPAVFVPCLRANRFPSRRQGGRTVWNVIQEQAVANADRYKGTVEDERRLFYVALTRAEKFLFCSWAPIPDNQQQRRVSEFFVDVTRSEHVLGADPKRARARAAAKPRVSDIPLALTFSELRYYFECPYQFKLRILYGFDAPISRALGYGKSLHDALCEIHAESIAGRVPTVADVPALVDKHLHLPFANSLVRDNSIRGANAALKQYLTENATDLTRLEHAEKPIEINLGEGIVLAGRIDLIRRLDTDERIIVDFKSAEDTQPKEISKLQVHVYAGGYEKTVGKSADLLEIYNLDAGHVHREEVDGAQVQAALDRVLSAGRKIRKNELPKHEAWCTACRNCDVAGICRSKQVARGTR